MAGKDEKSSSVFSGGQMIIANDRQPMIASSCLIVICLRFRDVDDIRPFQPVSVVV